MSKLSNQPAQRSSTRRRRPRCGNGKPSQARSGAWLFRLLLSHSRRDHRDGNLKITTSKLQRSFNPRFQTFASHAASLWGLKFGISLDLGAWNLELSPEWRALVPKMPDAGEDHRHATFIGGGNHFLV